MSNSFKKIITSGGLAQLSYLTVDHLTENNQSENSNNVLLYNTSNGSFSYTGSYDTSNNTNAVSGGQDGTEFYMHDAFVSGNLQVSGTIAAAEGLTLTDITMSVSTSTGSFIFGSGSYNNELIHEVTGNLQLSSSVGITANMPEGKIGFHGTSSHTLNASQSLSSSFASSSDSASYATTASYALVVKGGIQQGDNGTFENITVNNDLTVKDNTKIEGQLEVDESSTFNSGVTIGGNLIVNGTHTILNTQDVFIEDRFIYLGGKQSKLFDCGIVFNNVRSEGPKDQGLGRYESIFWDQSAQRFKLATNVDPDKNDGLEPIPDEKIKGSIISIRDGGGYGVLNPLIPIQQPIIDPNVESLQPVYGSGELITTAKRHIYMFLSNPNIPETPWKRLITENDSATFNSINVKNSTILSSSNIYLPNISTSTYGGNKLVVLNPIDNKLYITGSWPIGNTAPNDIIPPFPFTGTAHITGSLIVSGGNGIIISASNNTIGLFGTSSYASQSVSSSFSTNAYNIFVNQEEALTTDHYFLITDSTNYSTASYSTQLSINPSTGNITGTSSYALYSSESLSASFASSSTSASYASSSLTASYALNIPDGLGGGGGLWFDGTTYWSSSLQANGDATKIGIGRQPTNYSLEVKGTIAATEDVIAYMSSDKRLKDNIKPIENPIEKIKQIGGYSFDWNDKQNIYRGADFGVIAQEIEEVLPSLVQTRENGYKGVKYDKIVSLLIEAVKDQQNQIDELKNQINNGS